MSLLELDDVNLTIGDTPILRDVSLSLESGQILGLVGESGSGKSMTALSVMRLLPKGAKLSGGITFEGVEIGKVSEREMETLRGDSIGMIFQEPMTALNPLMTIGDQVAETILIHREVGRAEARRVATQTLERVGLAAQGVAPTRYPHELSGGQRQRVGIAMAVALRPKLLIADEPTTALDVTTQAQILDLLSHLVHEEGMAMMLIAHDLAVVSQMAGTIAVMQAGRVVEAGPAGKLLRRPDHDYTRRLLEATTHTPDRGRHEIGPPLLTVTNLVRTYRSPREIPLSAPTITRAVDGVSFGIGRGESVGLVGESGSGKSTLARAILGLETPQAGMVTLVETQVRYAGRAAFATLREMQMVFQDPYGSFNPRHRVARLVAEPLHLLGPSAPDGRERRRRVEGVLEAVGIESSMAERYIHEFSGGQRQRIAIARALIVEPSLIVLDEAVSALDVSIRAQILDLLAAISRERKVSYLFIAHDLHVVRAITDRVLVMKSGRIVESGETRSVLDNPRHAYTQSLIAAAPSLGRERTTNAG